MGSYDQAVKDSSKAYGDKMAGQQRKGIQTTSDGKHYPHSVTAQNAFEFGSLILFSKVSHGLWKKCGLVHQDSESGSRVKWCVKKGEKNGVVAVGGRRGSCSRTPA